ncbi:FtsX-like permease family protein [Simiduia curdlanivorans]|uniref:ABC transporter permease n=1 Tax=Simiduia curdlanivorans TaxID=1492769 RepID=A0ABV8V9M0_9GAMM|nr:FtsX-like permease family protein [Simiduia curdlanivorans]MDN3639784.1 FtsX-like permease family protein [Simiduia curdlanivorans]
MLSIRLLYRNLRSPEVRILGLATLMAVALVSAIAIFTDRLQQAMETESHAFIAADRLIRSNKPINEQWYVQADAAGLKTAQTISFASMVFNGDHSHLASVKAVSTNYPLIGKLETRLIPFGDDPVKFDTTGPNPGEVWVESRLFPLLKLSVGQSIEVGERLLVVSRVLVSEPDRNQGFMNFGARVLMHVDDLASTGVIQEGSRATFSLLLAGSKPSIDQYLKDLSPALSVHERVVDVASAQKRIARSLETARSFLMLASVFGVLLAGIAIAIAAQRFCSRHIDQVALLKSLGAVSGQIRKLYLAQLAWLALLASVFGLILGLVVQSLIAQSIAQLVTVSLPAPSLFPAMLGVLAGFLCLFFFALPPLWPLPQVAPIKVLRREMVIATTPKLAQLGIGLVSLFLLLWVYSGAFVLSSSVMAIWTAVAVIAVLLARAGIWLLGRYAVNLGSQWRLAIASLKRRGGESSLQVVVFGTALMLLATLLLVRSSLIEEWRLQLPAEAPNHFVVNLGPQEIASFEQLLAAKQLQHKGLYPLVRGRITQVNGEDARARKAIASQDDKTQEDNAEPEGPEALSRELNLSWSAELPAENIIEAGQWWVQDKPGVFISVEQEMAKSMNLALGDTLTFSIGGLTLDAEVQSIRSLRWDSLQPNFYVLFQPGALAQFAPMYMTSLHVPSDQGRFVANLLTQHPTVLVIEMEKIFEQVRQVITQVSGAVELVFWLVLVAALLVLVAAISASMDSRIQELGLLRAMGVTRTLLRQRLFVEFCCLGLLSGLIAALGAESMLWALQTLVFKIQWVPHPWIWLLTPGFSGLLIGAIGFWACRHLVNLPPATVLRMAAS